MTKQMIYIVTGASGFIGSNIIRGLNARGITNIIAIDNLTDGHKFLNLVNTEIAHYMDKTDFMNALLAHQLPFNGQEVKAVFHQGACSDTMEYNGVFMMDNNYQYSLNLFEWCQDNAISFLYASSGAVYGKGDTFQEERAYESPLNIFAYSKFLFDQVVRRRIRAGLKAQVVGLRYFNVYGMNEQHKGRMASVVYHHFNQYRERGYVELFGAYNGYSAGTQQRDFVSIDDVVRVNLFFLDTPEASGIYNLGTGKSRTFNDLATTTINTCRAQCFEPALSLDEMVNLDLIRYINFPETLKGKYQCFTQADISKLREVGYKHDFETIEQGISNYIGKLITL